MRNALGQGVLCMLVLTACGGGGDKEPAFKMVAQEDLQLLAEAKKYFAPLPETVTSADNPQSPAKIALGRALYFDTRLSVNGTVSCNSCHRLEAFGVDGERTPLGVGKQRGLRNVPSVYNSATHALQMWDGRVSGVEQQVGVPVLDPLEMGMADTAAVEAKLRKADDLVVLFAAAFPGEKDPVTFGNMAKAIGAFERTLQTPGRFDAFIQGDAAAMTAEEKAGLKTFMDVGCTTCHTGPALGGQLMQKFGLLADFRPLTGSTDADLGRMNTTKSEADRDLFKSCGLRNVGRTAPYFHDGSVTDLGKAVQIMAQAQLKKDLTDQQVKDVVAFLNALTGELPKGVEAPPAAK